MKYFGSRIGGEQGDYADLSPADFFCRYVSAQDDFLASIGRTICPDCYGRGTDETATDDCPYCAGVGSIRKQQNAA